MKPGDRFGRLTVIGPFDRRTTSGERWVALRCDCGTVTASGRRAIESGKKQGCATCDLHRRRPDLVGPPAWETPEAKELLSTPYARTLHLRYKAGEQYRAARRRGELVAPRCCSACKAVGRVEGHHRDYSRPLDVVWLCPTCHSAEHVAMQSSRIRALLAARSRHDMRAEAAS